MRSSFFFFFFYNAKNMGALKKVKYWSEVYFIVYID